MCLTSQRHSPLTTTTNSTISSSLFVQLLPVIMHITSRKLFVDKWFDCLNALLTRVQNVSCFPVIDSLRCHSILAHFTRDHNPSFYNNNNNTITKYTITHPTKNFTTFMIIIPPPSTTSDSHTPLPSTTPLPLPHSH